MRKQRLVWLGILALLLAACSPAAPPTAAPPAAVGGPDGTLVIALPAFSKGEALHAYEGGLTGKAQWDLLYDYVLGMTSDRKLVPMLATQWSMSPDGLSWTFNLREDVKFHDGTNLTAEDVKFTIELIQRPGSTYTGRPLFVDTIDRVEVVSPYQFIVHNKAPSDQIGFILSEGQGLGIVPKAYVEQVGIDRFMEQPMGSGPARFVSRKLGEYVTLEALDQHWGRTARFKTFTYLLVPEDNTRIAMLRTGQADLIQVPVDLANEVRRTGVEVRTVSSVQNIWLNFGGMYSPGHPSYSASNPFLNKDVRQAVNLAINRNELAQQIYQGTTEPAALPLFAPNHLGYDSSWKPYPYDPEMARRLLAQAGYPNGLELTMWVYPLNGAPEVPDLCEALGIYFERVGLKTTLRPYESEAAVRDTINGLTLPPSIMYPGQLAANDDHGVARVRTYYGTQGKHAQLADVSDLEARLDQALDPLKRGELYRVLLQRIYDDYLSVPIANTPVVWAVGKKVGDWPAVQSMPQMTKLSEIAHRTS